MSAERVVASEIIAGDGPWASLETNGATGTYTPDEQMANGFPAAFPEDGMRVNGSSNSTIANGNGVHNGFRPQPGGMSEQFNWGDPRTAFDFEIPRELDPQFPSQVVEQYREFHNIENDHDGKVAHNVFVDSLYSAGIPLVLMTMYNSIEDSEVKRKLLGAFGNLQDALNTLEIQARIHGTTLAGALYEMQSSSHAGNGEYARFKEAMMIARESALAVIQDHHSLVPDETELPRQRNGTVRNFGEQVEEVLLEDKEAKQGIELSETFKERLQSPQTKVVAVSVDINSTFLPNESHATPENVVVAVARLRTFIEEFQNNPLYKEKELLLVINTGRPTHYAWGILEMFASMPEVRKLGLAESGGVQFWLEGTALMSKVVVKDPEQWEDNLHGFKNHLAARVNQEEEKGGKLKQERKDSMLSFYVGENKNYKHVSVLGEEVNRDWVEREKETWFEQQKQRLEAGMESARDLEDSPEKNRKLELLNKQLEFSEEMRGLLKVDYNERAGYIDISNKHNNKYASLLKIAREQMHCTTDEIVGIHIGDTGSDIAPVDDIGPGEPNEGADKFFVVAVANSSPNMKKAVQARGEYGVIAARDSVLAVEDMATALYNAVKIPDQLAA